MNAAGRVMHLLGRNRLGYTPFDSIAAQYDASQANARCKAEAAELRPLLCRLLVTRYVHQRQRRVLDVGCGTGFLLDQVPCRPTSMSGSIRPTRCCNWPGRSGLVTRSGRPRWKTWRACASAAARWRSVCARSTTARSNAPHCLTSGECSCERARFFFSRTTGSASTRLKMFGLLEPHRCGLRTQSERSPRSCQMPS